MGSSRTMLVRIVAFPASLPMLFKKVIPFLLCSLESTFSQCVVLFIVSLNIFTSIFGNLIFCLHLETLWEGSISLAPIQNHAVEVMKSPMIQDVLLCYPDHNLPFQIFALMSVRFSGELCVLELKCSCALLFPEPFPHRLKCKYNNQLLKLSVPFDPCTWGKALN